MTTPISMLAIDLANRWLATLVMRKPKMVAAVALANKMARMIWH